MGITRFFSGKGSDYHPYEDLKDDDDASHGSDVASGTFSRDLSVTDSRQTIVRSGGFTNRNIKVEEARKATLDHNGLVYSSSEGSLTMAAANTLARLVNVIPDLILILKWVMFPFKLMYDISKIAMIGARQSPVIAGGYVLFAFYVFSFLPDILSGVYWQQKELERVQLVAQTKKVMLANGINSQSYTGPESPYSIVSAYLLPAKTTVNAAVTQNNTAGVKTYTVKKQVVVQKAAKDFKMTINDFCLLNNVATDHIFKKGEKIYFYD